MQKIASFIAASLLLTVCSAPVVWGQSAPLSPYEAAAKAKQVKYDINWMTSLDKAKEQAKATHKPIFWMHMLGNIDGFA
jgi:hypothetical protein